MTFLEMFEIRYPTLTFSDGLGYLVEGVKETAEKGREPLLELLESLKDQAIKPSSKLIIKVYRDCLKNGVASNAHPLQVATYIQRSKPGAFRLLSKVKCSKFDDYLEQVKSDPKKSKLLKISVSKGN